MQGWNSVPALPSGSHLKSSALWSHASAHAWFLSFPLVHSTGCHHGRVGPRGGSEADLRSMTGTHGGLDLGDDKPRLSLCFQAQSQGSITLKIIPATQEEDRLKESKVQEGWRWGEGSSPAFEKVIQEEITHLALEHELHRLSFSHKVIHSFVPCLILKRL